MKRSWPSPWSLARQVVLVVALIGAGFAGGVSAERAHLLPGSVYLEPASLAPTFSVFWQAWDLVQQHYVNPTARNPTQMTYGAIEGMLDSLGDVGHTRFLSPSEFQEEQAFLAGRLEGIGAEITIRDRRPTIVAPIPGSPAQQAGLRAGDTIVRVNGQDVSGLSTAELVHLVRGPAGTTVTLTVLHEGETRLVDISVVRAKLTIPNIAWTRLPGTSVADLLVRQFAEHTTDDLIAAIKQARADGATAFVLDLRDDPGGLRDEAIGVASQFLRNGTVLIEQDAQGHRTTFPVRPGGIATDVPLVVLTNEGTASSAEIVAGALQDHRRAPIVGSTTFGTGTVLSIFHLSDGSAIFLGTSQWLTPNGREIWHHGISPDLAVELPAGGLPLTPDQAARLTPAQLQASQDTQLLRALDVVARQPVGR